MDALAPCPAFGECVWHASPTMKTLFWTENVEATFCAAGPQNQPSIPTLVEACGLTGEYRTPKDLCELYMIGCESLSSVLPNMTHCQPRYSAYIMCVSSPAKSFATCLWGRRQSCLPARLLGGEFCPKPTLQCKSESYLLPWG